MGLSIHYFGKALAKSLVNFDIVTTFVTEARVVSVRGEGAEKSPAPPRHSLAAKSHGNDKAFCRKPLRALPDEEERYEYKGALRGTPGSAYPEFEPNATELPSCAPISAYRQLRKDSGGEKGTRRPVPPRLCWNWIPPLEDGDGYRDEHICAPVLRDAQHAPRHVLRHVLRHVFHVPVLHAAPKGKPVHVRWAWVSPLGDDAHQPR